MEEDALMFKKPLGVELCLHQYSHLSVHICCFFKCRKIGKYEIMWRFYRLGTYYSPWDPALSSHHTDFVSWDTKLFTLAFALAVLLSESSTWIPALPLSSCVNFKKLFNLKSYFCALFSKSDVRIIYTCRASLMVQQVKNPPANAGDIGNTGSIPG